jgi:methyl-accepting chemotaxis protein
LKELVGGRWLGWLFEITIDSGETKTMRSLTIKQSLTGAFLAVGLIPALVIGGVNYFALDKIAGNLRDSTKVHAVNVADKIDRNLFERYGDVQAFGINPAVQDRTNWYRVGAEQNAIVALSMESTR